MQTVKSSIEEAVQLEELDTDLYRSKSLWRPDGARGVFGGQVVGQSLMAANRTVKEQFAVHSLHSYFLLPGDPSIPIIYRVNRVREGRSYCTRTVHAVQKGRGIFICEISYHIPEMTELEHQIDRNTKVPLHPDNLPTRDEIVQNIINDPKITPEIIHSIKFHVFEPFDLEIRFTETINIETLIKAEASPPKQSFWIRVSHKLSDDFKSHQCIAAYATDHLLLSTALRPKGLHMWNPQIAFMTTIDHCIWFHSPFRIDEWLLYEMESPRATSGRGFALGRLYDQHGTLVLSCAQEGVIRLLNSKL